MGPDRRGDGSGRGGGGRVEMRGEEKIRSFGEIKVKEKKEKDNYFFFFLQKTKKNIIF